MNDDLDPEIQDRFALLDDVDPADTWPTIRATGAQTATAPGPEADLAHRRRLLAAAVGLAVVAGAGAIALASRPERDQVVSTPSTVVARPTTVAPTTTPVTVPEAGFTPPSIREDDRVAYPVTLLDGSKIAVTLPEALDFDPTRFEASATLASTDDPELPPIRIDVSFCPSCTGPDTLPFDGWAVVGTADEFDAEVWSSYADLLVGEVNADGYLVLSGPIRLGPIDGPDGMLLGSEGDDRAALYLRDCAGGPSPHTTTGLSLAVPDSSNPPVTRLCAPRQGVELWVSGPELTEELVDAVDLTVRRIGPRIEASAEYLFEEPADLGFPVCWELPETGPPVGDAAADADALLARLEADGVRDLEFLAGFGGAGNVWGRVAVDLSRRYGPSIDWLSQRAGPDDLCFQFLPEPGPPDQLVVPATWRVAPASQPVDERWQDLTLLVPGDEEECGPFDPGRVLEPEVVEGPDAISITVELAVWDRGPQLQPAICRPPAEVQVRLTEPPNGRPLIGGE